ncbi:hypothetical protein [Hyphomicrobium sp. 2TAF46]|uniref:hypothetical protein n=1 Tax=Hyphomicrobium sp. 2TAF46 TaxID=3233019 RepID=UPI003F9031CD
MTEVIRTASPSTLSYKRSASTGAFSTLLLFALCWVGVFIGLPLVLSHAFIGLFTLEPAGSLSSLLIGGLSAFVAGGLTGVIIAHCYNLAGRFFGE